MPLPTPIILLVNSAILLVAILVAIVIVYLSRNYRHLIGDTPGQDRLRLPIIRLALSLLFLILAAAVFNLIVLPSL